MELTLTPTATLTQTLEHDLAHTLDPTHALDPTPALVSQRVAQAAVSILGTAADIAHEVLLTSVDFLDFAPVPGLQTAARTLLMIWDTLQEVDVSAPLFKSIIPSLYPYAWRGSIVLLLTL